MSLTLTDEQYTQMAIATIRGYKNFPYDITDDEITNQYSLAIPLIIQNLKDSFAIDKSVKQEKQGNRDTTYRDEIIVIDSTISLLIGLPYAKMF